MLWQQVAQIAQQCTHWRNAWINKLHQERTTTSITQLSHFCNGHELPVHFKFANVDTQGVVWLLAVVVYSYLLVVLGKNPLRDGITTITHSTSRYRCVSRPSILTRGDQNPVPVWRLTVHLKPSRSIVGFLSACWIKFIKMRGNKI